MLHVVRLPAVILLPAVKWSNLDSLFHGNITVMQSHQVVLLPVIIVASYKVPFRFKCLLTIQ